MINWSHRQGFKNICICIVKTVSAYKQTGGKKQLKILIQELTLNWIHVKLSLREALCDNSNALT